MSDPVLIPRGWRGSQVEVESFAGDYPQNERRRGELVKALDSGLVLRSKTGLRLYPWASIACVKLLESENGKERND